MARASPTPAQPTEGEREGMQQRCRLKGRSSSLALLYLHGAHTSTWKAARWQGRPRARTEEVGGGRMRTECVRGIKGCEASIAEQVQGLIGSGNGWSM